MPIRPENRARTRRHFTPAAIAARRAAVYPTIRCMECGETFSPYRLNNVRFCSSRCRHRHSHRRRIITKTCSGCGKPFRPAKSNKAAYCSNRCRHKALAIRMTQEQRDRQRVRAREYSRGTRYRFNQRNHKARRRSVYRDGGVTTEEWEIILRRFKNCCAYCCSGGAMTMDHVVPLSKGGVHAANNVVPACRKCNSAKCDQAWSPRIPACL
jgi:5-methylcytosine-specific restriction endonuclease McrA